MSRTALFALLAILLVSCGTGDRERDAASVSDRFHSALEQHDGAAACEELSEETASKLEANAGAPCVEAILELDLPAGAASSSAEVYVTSAYVELAEAGSVFLDKGDDGWKVSAAGCVPAAGDVPWQCELEG